MKHLVATVLANLMLLAIATNTCAQLPRPSPPATGINQQSIPDQHHGEGDSAAPPKSKIVISSEIREPSSAPQTKDGDNKAQKWLDRHAAFGPQTWSNWALAVFAAIASIIALRTLGAVAHQAVIAERALTRDKIPYVVVKELGPDSLSIIEGKINLSYTLKNYGTGPAFLRAVIGQADILEKLGPIPHVRPMEALLPVGRVIAAGDETAPIEAHSRIVSVSGTEQESAVYNPAAKYKIFFYGLVNYTDIWENEWTNGFAWIFDPEVGAMRLARKNEVPDGYNYHHKEECDAKPRRNSLRKFFGVRGAN